MKFSRKKLVLSMALLGLTSMVSVSVYAAKPAETSTTTTTLPAVPLNWTAGTATVDGNTSDWNLSTDASTRMCEAGWINTDGSCNGKEQLSTLYTRYDCNTNTMYVLVLKAAGHTADNSASWVKVYTLGNSPRVQGPSNSANFHDVTVGGVVQGYEASFTLAANTYNDVEVHLEVDGSRTSSTGKVQYTRSIVVPENCTVPTSTTTTSGSGSTTTPTTSGSGSTTTPTTSGSGSTTTPTTSGTAGPTSGTVGGYGGFTSWGQCQSTEDGGTTLSVVGRLLPTSGNSVVAYNDSSVTGEVYNNSNTPQTVTLVSYKEFYPDTNFDDKNVNGVLVPGQRVHNYQTVTVPANGHVNLTAQLPGCSTQIDLVCADVIQYLGGGNLYGMRKLAYYHAHQPNNAWCNSTGVTSWNGAFEAAAQAAVDAAAADAAAQAAADAAAKAAADKAAADAATKAAADAAAAQAATEAAEAAAQQAAAAKAAEEAAAAQAAADAAAAQATADAIAAEAAAKAAEEAAAAEAAAKAAAEAAAAAAAQQAAEAAAQQAAAETAAAEAAAKAAAEAVAKAADEEAKKAAEEAQKKADEEAAANKLAEEEAAKAAEEAAAEAKKQADEAAAAEEAAAKAAEEAAKVAEEATKTAEDANCAGTTGADAPTSTTVSWADDKGTNSYDFTVTKEGNTWTYQVDKAGGKDLSHWTLIAPSCVTHVGNATNGVEIGQDGSIKDRDVSGIKWNTTGGTFSFTLDGDYAVNTVEVLAKAGNSYSTSMIMGPDCSMPASNQCPPKDPEVPVAVSGAFYNADDSICSYVPKATQSKNGKDLSGWTVPQWVAVEGYIEATKGGEPAGETTVALVGNDTVKICSAGLMVGSCHEDDAKAMQSVTTNEEGKADFTALVYWPGVSAADRAEGGTVNSSYSVNVMGGPAGTTVVGGLAKQLLWNPGMMNSGCTLTLKAKKNHN